MMYNNGTTCKAFYKFERKNTRSINISDNNPAIYYLKLTNLHRSVARFIISIEESNFVTCLFPPRIRDAARALVWLLYLAIYHTSVSIYHTISSTNSCVFGVKLHPGGNLPHHLLHLFCRISWAPLHLSGHICNTISHIRSRRYTLAACINTSSTRSNVTWAISGGASAVCDTFHLAASHEQHKLAHINKTMSPAPHCRHRADIVSNDNKLDTNVP